MHQPVVLEKSFWAYINIGLSSKIGIRGNFTIILICGSRNKKKYICEEFRKTNHEMMLFNGLSELCN